MVDLREKAPPSLGRWLKEATHEEPYHGQVESRPVSSPTLSSWLHPDVPGPTLALPERWDTKVCTVHCTYTPYTIVSR